MIDVLEGIVRTDMDWHKDEVHRHTLMVIKEVSRGSIARIHPLKAILNVLFFDFH